jgi:hypothetical protein
MENHKLIECECFIRPRSNFLDDEPSSEDELSFKEGFIVGALLALISWMTSPRDRDS